MCYIMYNQSVDAINVIKYKNDNVNDLEYIVYCCAYYHFFTSVLLQSVSFVTKSA